LEESIAATTGLLFEGERRIEMTGEGATSG
jgi:hypothetical protein